MVLALSTEFILDWLGVTMSLAILDLALSVYLVDLYDKASFAST